MDHSSTIAIEDFAIDVPNQAHSPELKVVRETLSLRAADGRSLAAQLTHARGAPRAIVVISSAMGVPMRFYAGFANFLAEAGISVLSYDYRGIGGSKQEHVRTEPARLLDWGRLDAQAAHLAALTRWPELPVIALTHSIGGQLLSLSGVSGQLAGVVLVGSQMGYWRHWQGSARWFMAAMWFAVIPTLSRICGFLPMRVFRQGEDLPGGVARDWALWGKHRRSLFDAASSASGAHPGFEQLTAPVLALSFADDAYAPHAAVKALLAEMPHAHVQHWHQDAQSVRKRPIGHFRFFRPSVAPELWDQLAQWLLMRKPGSALDAEKAQTDAAHRAWLYR